METAAIKHHLPALRRHARAVLGSQERGDAWVKAMVVRVRHEAPAADLPPWVQLLRALHAVEPPAAAADRPQQGVVGHNAALLSRVRDLPDIDRRILLLAVMEGMTAEHIARILGIRPDCVPERLIAAKQKLKAQKPTMVLIIEDEPVIAIDIARIIRRVGHRIVGVADTAGSAVAMARAHRPGLILADLKLRDGSSGLRAVEQILTLSDVPTIFITAFPESLLTGWRPEPTFLITKPFTTDVFNVTVSQALAAREVSPAVAAE